MRPRLLVTRQVFAPTLEALAPHFDVEANQDDAVWDAAELHRRVRDKHALFVTAADTVDAALIDAAPELKIIATGSVGYNQIDVARCRERGIVVTNTPAETEAWLRAWILSEGLAG